APLRDRLAARHAALRVHVPRVKEVVRANHRAPEHVAGVPQADAEPVHLPLAVVREGRRDARALPDLQDLEGLWCHHPAFREVIEMSVAHDRTGRRPRGVEDDLLDAILDDDTVLVEHSHAVTSGGTRTASGSAAAARSSIRISGT